jgi:NodT family efflux transporter outer membrane factor (OMF) lipoprotein
MKSKFKYHFSLMLFPLFLSGCGVATINFDVPPNWTSEKPRTPDAEVDPYPDSGWAGDFNDPLLTQYVTDALAHNHDLVQAAASRDIARAQLKKAGSGLWPVLDLRSLVRRSGSLDSSDSGGFSNFGGSFSNSDFSSGGGGSTTYDVSLDVSWEIDVWGRVRAGKKVALYEYYAAENDYAAARQSLAAQTAKAYLQTIESSKQLELARAFEKNLKNTLDVTQAFYDEGLISLQDVHLVKSDLARARESIRNAESADLLARRSLEILMGKYPAAMIENETDYPALPAPVPAGIPAELLERRPDLIAAERRVHAAFERTEQAKAARLPQISLTGSFGGTSDQLRDLTDPANVIWSAAGNLLFPIFNAGNLKADVDIRTAEQQASLAQYRQTALNAFGEVETAISNEQLFRHRSQDLDEAYENAKQAENIADANFKAGEIELLDLLQIKRNTIAIRIDRARAQRELLEQRVNLHLSLGGKILSQETQPTENGNSK